MSRFVRPVQTCTRCRSISERLLGARLVLQRVSSARALSFEYLNRQLVSASWGCAHACMHDYNKGLRVGLPPRLQVWQELSELLLFLLPLLDVTQLRRRLLMYLPRISGPSAAGGVAAVHGAGCEQPRARWDMASSGRVNATLMNAGGDAVAAGRAPNQACGVCAAASMPQPYHAEPCGHLFCYYCLRSSTEADMHFLCPLCSERVAAIKPALRPVSKGAVLLQ